MSLKNRDIIRIEKFRSYLRKFERSVEFQMKKSTCCKGVTLKQCHTLLALNELSTSTLNSLADKLVINKSSASRTVENLFKMNLISREINPNNRRETILSLTAKGVDVVESINRENNELYSKLLNKIPNNQIDNIINSLEILSDALYERV